MYPTRYWRLPSGFTLPNKLPSVLFCHGINLNGFPAACPLLCRKMLSKKSKAVAALASLILGRTPLCSAALMAGEEICEFVGGLFLLRAKSHSG